MKSILQSVVQLYVVVSAIGFWLLAIAPWLFGPDIGPWHCVSLIPVTTLAAHVCSQSERG